MAYKTRKVIVFILEGWSDKNALEGLLRRIYTNRFIFSVVTYGDITSNLDIDIGDLDNTIYETIKKRISEDKIRMSDIANIIQICDTDGVFVPESNVVLGNSKGILYSTTEIRTSDVEKTIERNNHKKEALKYLLNKTAIKKIPYQLFYMSCNLDHVLYDEQNLTDSLKVSYADNFFKEFQNCSSNFIPFIREKAFGVPATYRASWDYISNDLHSLERHNNFFLCFDEHPPFAQ